MNWPELADTSVEAIAIIALAVIVVKTGGDPVAIGGMIAGIAGYRRAKAGKGPNA